MENGPKKDGYAHQSGGLTILLKYNWCRFTNANAWGNGGTGGGGADTIFMETMAVLYHQQYDVHHHKFGSWILAKVKWLLHLFAVLIYYYGIKVERKVILLIMA